VSIQCNSGETIKKRELAKKTLYSQDFRTAGTNTKAKCHRLIETSSAVKGKAESAKLE
jgi:hypothetical protein